MRPPSVAQEARYWMVSLRAAAVVFFGSMSSSTPSAYFACDFDSSSS